MRCHVGKPLQAGLLKAGAGGAQVEPEVAAIKNKCYAYGHIASTLDSQAMVLSHRPSGGK